MAVKQYARGILLRDPRFAGYQEDFLAAILCRPEYTIAEAEKAVKAFFDKKESD